MRVSMSDIRQRAYFLSESESNINKKYQITDRYLKALESQNPKEIMFCLESWDKIPGKSEDERFINGLNLLEALSYNSYPGEITKAGLLLEKKAIKVKSTKQIGDNVKNSIKGLKNKSSRKKNKIKKDLEKNIEIQTTDANGKPIKLGAQPQQQQQPQGQQQNPQQPADPNQQPQQQDQQQQTEANENALINSFESIEESLHKLTHIDRILENYEKISSRFNIEKVLEQKLYKESTYDTIEELCELIDTYDVDNIVKYNTVLESAWYAYNRLGINVNRADILESATDYFLIKDNLEDCKYVLESSVLYTDKEKSRVNYVLEEDDGFRNDAKDFAEEEDIEDAIDEYAYNTIHEDSNNEKKENNTQQVKKPNIIQKAVALPKKIISKIPKKDEDTSSYVSKEKANQIINDYKKKIHDPGADNRLMQVVNSIFVDYTSIMEGIPSFFNLLRDLLIVGTIAINPILGALAAVVDICLRLKLGHNETEKMREAFIEEKYKIDNKLKTAKSEKEKERLQQYSDKLARSIERLTDHQNENILNDKLQAERDEKDEEKAQKREEKELKKQMKKNGGSTSVNDDGDFDFDDNFDFDFNFEAANLALSSFANINENTDIINIISENANLLAKNNVLYNLCTISKLYPKFINPYEMTSIVENNYRDIRNNSIIFESLVDKCIIVDEYARCKEELNKKVSYKENYSFKEACNLFYNISNLYSSLRMISEANNKDPATINNNTKQVPQPQQPQTNDPPQLNSGKHFKLGDVKDSALSFKNTINIALDKMRKTFSNLTGKERQVSQEFDATVEGMAQSSYKAMMNNNREAILKGSILPSASKTLKIVLASGLGFLVNPWLGVIPILAYMGTNKFFSHKEKIAILDEIEIELQMTEKRLSIAESENDLEAQQQLLKIQRELQRQQSQIKKGLLKDNKYMPDPDVTAVSGGK